MAGLLSALYISKAIWEMNEEESEEENEDVEWAKLQCVINEVWHNKWRHTVNNVPNKDENRRVKCTVNEPTGPPAAAARVPARVNGEDNIPPLVPLPKTDIYDYAREKGLIRSKDEKPKRRRGTTVRSTGQAPITCIL